MYEQCSMKNTKLERSEAMATKVSIMKHGWCQMVNKTVHCYQTPCNVAAIVEQLSSYNSMLREKIEMEECEIQQKHKSSDVNKLESKLSASGTECFSAMIEEKHEGDDKAFNKNWIIPKKCISTKCFDAKSKIKEEHDVENNKSNILIDMNNNKYNALSCEDEKEEGKEHHTMACKRKQCGHGK